MTEEKRVFDQMTEIANDRYEITLQSLKERGLCLVSENLEEFVKDLNETDVNMQMKVITHIIDESYKHYKEGMGDINVRTVLKRFPEMLKLIKESTF